MSSRRDDGGSACVSRSPIPVRAAFLRNVYCLLTVQQLIIAIVSYTLFMTPGVRPFVQHYGSTTWLTVLALVISIFFLRHTRHSPHFLGLAFTVFTITAALACGVVLTAKFDTDVVYTVSIMNAGVFLGHVVYCIQSITSLRFLPSLIGTICLAVVEAWIIESVLVIATFDYFLCVLLCCFICAYVNWNIYDSMKCLSRNDVLLACNSVFISFPKMHY